MRSRTSSPPAQGGRHRIVDSHHRSRALVAMALLMTALIPALAGAQSMSLDSVVTTPGAAVTTTLRLTHTQNADGFSCGLSHDPTMLTIVSVTPGAALDSAQGGIDPDVFLVQENPGATAGLTIACLISLGPPPFETLPPGSNQPIASIEYQAAPMSGSTLVSFTDTLGAPPVELLLVEDAMGLIPSTSPATIILENVFRRGDCNLDNDVDLADAVCLLRVLFLSEPIFCEDSMDINDTGALNIIDATDLLQYLFNGGVEPPTPGPFGDCAADPTADALGCETFGACL